MAERMKWTECSVPDPEVRRLAEALDCPPLIARLLLSRGRELGEKSAALRFLEPRLKHFEDPFRIQGMEATVNRLMQAIDGSEKLLVFGDYDVDGITSTVALIEFLKGQRLEPDFLVPRRLEEGYGLSQTAVDRALDQFGIPDLFIALDCGTNSVGVVQFLEEKGCDVLVIDHHQSRNGDCVSCLMINPHHFHADEDPAPPWKELSTAGLVFKVIHALVKRFREDGRAGADSLRVADYLDLCALGTVADLVRLTGENRLIAHGGLKCLAAATRPGLRALFQLVGIPPGSELEAADISFKLGPRINAVGRLDDARIPVELLLGQDDDACLKQARILEAHNRERKSLENKIFEEALEQVATLGLEHAPGIMVADGNWHHGVVGIVASRLMHRYHRPCLVLGGVEPMDGDSGQAERKGSGRSIPGVDLVAVLEYCNSWIRQWGGHPMAVGLTVLDENIEDLRRGFAEALRNLHPGGLPERGLELAAWVNPEEVDAVFLENVERLKPFGQGNPRPVFGLRQVYLAGPPRLLKGEHFRFSVERNGRGPLVGIAWRMGNRLPPADQPLDLAVRIGWNDWRGRRTLQLELADWRRG